MFIALAVAVAAASAGLTGVPAAASTPASAGSDAGVQVRNDADAPVPESSPQGSATSDTQPSTQSNAVTLPFKGSLTQVPPVRKLLAQADLPVPGTTVVLIGGLVAECATANATSGVLTACGTAVIPPAQGKTSHAKGNTYCNSAPRIRSTSFATTAALPGSGAAPGLFVQVTDGMIYPTNPDVRQSFTAGQFGYTGSVPKAPTLPATPSIQFSPPPSLPQTQPAVGGPSAKPASIDCEVRSLPRTSLRAKAADSASTAQGSIVFISAGGLRPTSSVSVYLLSAPNAALGEFKTDVAGNLAAWVRMPATSALGPDVLQVNGFIPEGYSASLNTGIDVRAAVRSKSTEPVYFASMSTELSKASRASLDETLAMIPMGSSVRCVVTPVIRDGDVEPALVELATSRATVTAEYLNDRGLVCRVSVAPAVTHGTTYRARRANLTIAYDH